MHSGNRQAQNGCPLGPARAIMLLEVPSRVQEEPDERVTSRKTIIMTATYLCELKCEPNSAMDGEVFFL